MVYQKIRKLHKISFGYSIRIHKTFYNDFALPQQHILRLFDFIADGIEIDRVQNANNNTCLQTRQEKINHAAEMTEKGCKEFFKSEKYAQYLDMVTTFNNYSARNIMLILMQKPDVTYVTS